MNVIVDSLVLVLLALAYAAQMARWLRVLQREHYEASAMMRFLGRWSAPQSVSAKVAARQRPRARARARVRRPFTLSHVFMVLIVGAILLRSYVALAVVSGLYGLLCPQGLAIRGKTSPLEWTRRLRTVALVAFVISLVVTALGAFTAQPFIGAIVMVLAVPPLLDLVTRLLGPLENRRAEVFVRQAQARLERIHPHVVAITGSYGKTSTKNHLLDLLGGDAGVVASPRSFNNRAGLSRAVNENMAEDTRVFIAEMGTYGPGEIRALTQWCVPEIAVVTAIGPVHLERMKSLDVIEAAKREITERATTVVLNVDDARLAGWTASLELEGKHVVRAGSSNPECDVRLEVVQGRWTLFVDGTSLGGMEEIVGVQPTNVACALGAAKALGVASATLMERLHRIVPVTHRLNVVTAPSGVVVIDDTFNANPASAAVALRALAALPVKGRRVVVTPGLIELGSEQYNENLRLATHVEAVPAELVIVARTNVVALESAFTGTVRRFDTRDEAVAWVRASLVAGDGVLYLNDLPDHYP